MTSRALYLRPPPETWALLDAEVEARGGPKRGLQGAAANEALRRGLRQLAAERMVAEGASLGRAATRARLEKPR